ARCTRGFAAEGYPPETPTAGRLRMSAARRVERAMSSRVFGVRAVDAEPDRRPILRLAHPPAEGIPSLQEFEEKPQQEGGFFRALSGYGRTGPKNDLSRRNPSSPVPRPVADRL